MTFDDKNATWAVIALDMAFAPPLEGEAREAAVMLIVRYFQDAVYKGADLEHARMALYNEFLDTAPVIEPLKHLLRRVLRRLDGPVPIR